MAGRPATWQIRVAGRPATWQIRVAGRPATWQIRVAGRPATWQIRVEGRPATWQVGVAGRPATWQIRVAGRPATWQIRVAGRPATWQIRVAGRPATWQIRVAGRPATWQIRVAGRPATWQIRVAGRPATWQIRVAGRPAMWQIRVAGRPAMWQIRVAGRPAMWQIRVAGRPATHPTPQSATSTNAKPPPTPKPARPPTPQPASPPRLDQASTWHTCCTPKRHLPQPNLPASISKKLFFKIEELHIFDCASLIFESWARKTCIFKNLRNTLWSKTNYPWHFSQKILHVLFVLALLLYFIHVSIQNGTCLLNTSLLCTDRVLRISLVIEQHQIKISKLKIGGDEFEHLIIPGAEGKGMKWWCPKYCILHIYHYLLLRWQHANS